MQEVKIVGRGVDTLQQAMVTQLRGKRTRCF